MRVFNKIVNYLNKKGVSLRKNRPFELPTEDVGEEPRSSQIWKDPYKQVKEP